MKVLVRTHPCRVYFATGDDAREVHNAAGEDRDSPCFCTESFGDDGFAWSTAEEFEEDYEATFGKLENPDA